MNLMLHYGLVYLHRNLSGTVNYDVPRYQPYIKKIICIDLKILLRLTIKDNIVIKN